MAAYFFTVVRQFLAGLPQQRVEPFTGAHNSASPMRETPNRRELCPLLFPDSAWVLLTSLRI